jgi:hypothetical protein
MRSGCDCAVDGEELVESIDVVIVVDGFNTLLIT